MLSVSLNKVFPSFRLKTLIQHCLLVLHFSSFISFTNYSVWSEWNNKNSISKHAIKIFTMSKNVLRFGRKEMFYLTTYSTHFIYSYMVKDHSDSEKGNLLPSHRLLFLINSKGYIICIIPQTGEHIPQPLLH